MCRRYVDVKFGKNRNEPMYEHMKRPLVSRRVCHARPEPPHATHAEPTRPRPAPSVQARGPCTLRARRSRPAALLRVHRPPRQVVPGAPDALDSIQLKHLRDLPGPRQNPSRPKTNNRAMLAGEAVLAYWGRTKQRAKKGAEDKKGAGESVGG